jgi:hypothetical protein
MAAGPDSHTVEEEAPAEHPGEGEPVGGIEGEEHDHDDLAPGHDDHGHDAHGHGHDDHHDDHGSGGDAWVLVPIAIGLVIGLIVAIWFGLGSGASPLG